MTLDPRITPLAAINEHILLPTSNPAFDFEIASETSGSYEDTEEMSFTKSTNAERARKEKTSEITAEAYFERIKTGMTVLEAQDLRARLVNLTATLELAPRDQIVLREETQRLIAVVAQQQKAAAMGFSKFVTKDLIDEFRARVEMKRPELIHLSNFPRVIPEAALVALNRAKEVKLFDDFHVLTWNPTQEQVASVKDRVVKKDPILFATFRFDPNTFYYITDWIDETCDLTFAKMVDALKELYPNYEPAEVRPLAQADLDYLIGVAQKRAAAVERTNVRRFRSDAVILSMEHEQFTFSAAGRVLLALARQAWRAIKDSRVRLTRG